MADLGRISIPFASQIAASVQVERQSVKRSRIVELSKAAILQPVPMEDSCWINEVAEDHSRIADSVYLREGAPG